MKIYFIDRFSSSENRKYVFVLWWTDSILILQLQRNTTHFHSFLDSYIFKLRGCIMKSSSRRRRVTVVSGKNITIRVSTRFLFFVLEPYHHKIILKTIMPGRFNSSFFINIILRRNSSRKLVLSAPSRSLFLILSFSFIIISTLSMKIRITISFHL